MSNQNLNDTSYEVFLAPNLYKCLPHEDLIWMLKSNGTMTRLQFLSILWWRIPSMHFCAFPRLYAFMYRTNSLTHQGEAYPSTSFESNRKHEIEPFTSSALLRRMNLHITPYEDLDDTRIKRVMKWAWIVVELFMENFPYAWAAKSSDLEAWLQQM